MLLKRAITIALFVCLIISLIGCTLWQKQGKNARVIKTRQPVQIQPVVEAQPPAQMVKDKRVFDTNIISFDQTNTKFKKLECLWRIENLSNQIRPTPDTDGYTLYLNFGEFAAIDTKTGIMLWRFSGDPARGRTGGSNIDSSPYLIGDLFIAGTQSGVWAIDRKTSNARWIYKIDSWVQAPVHIDAENDRVFVGAWDKKFHAIRLSNGERLWTCPTQNRVGSEACLLNEFVYFVDGNNLVCLKADDGQRVAEISFSKLPISGPIATKNDTVYIWCSDGNLYEINPVNGKADNKKLEIQRQVKISEYWSWSQEEKPGFSPWPQQGFPQCRNLWVGKLLILLNNLGTMVCFDIEKNEKVWDFAKLGMPDKPFAFSTFGKKQLVVSLNNGSIVTMDI
ncbi:MAG: PQQ-binding-like beta-propeller repeat protein, partial [bacterium]|nr:PQQ-binding-like beta-propeller repeat protein [bacterium]